MSELRVRVDYHFNEECVYDLFLMCTVWLSRYQMWYFLKLYSLHVLPLLRGLFYR